MGEQPFPEETAWAVAGPDPGSSVGVIVPYDFALDRELWRWVPDSSSLHVTRTPFVASPVTADQARAISDPEPVRRATRDVLVPEPGVVAFACTSGSFVDGVTGETALIDVMQEAGAPQSITTAGALATACAALGAERISVVTPYVDDLTTKLEHFLLAHGVTTVDRVGLGLLGQIWRVPYSEVVRAVRAADQPDAQAVFISCTNLNTYDVIAELEREVGKPVLTANQITMWAALGTVGQQAVGPGQSLMRCRVPEGPRPVLRVVPEVPDEPPAPSDRDAVDGTPGVDSIDGADSVDGVDTTPPSLYKVRVRLPDESGALARLTAAVAEAGGNILSLSVHGQDSRSVVDEMLVGGAVSITRLTDVVRGALPSASPGAVRVIAADPHELVDVPTRALDLVSQARAQYVGARDADGLVQGLAGLLHADEVRIEDDAPDCADDHALGLPAPGDGWMVAHRAWAPFTVTERGRAEAFLRAATAHPRRAGYEVLLPDGEEVVATPATGEEVGELDELLRTCDARPPDHDPADDGWTAGDLRALLLPPGGSCLVVRTADGSLVAAAALLDREAPEPVVLVHPRYRGNRLAGWLRRKLATAVAA